MSSEKYTDRRSPEGLRSGHRSRIASSDDEEKDNAIIPEHFLRLP